ncbi:MAG: hypothetical protein AAFV53_27540 [Myxococcota bacterium]
MSTLRIVLLITFLVIASLAGLFTWQNLPRISMLSFHLGFAGIETAKPAPVVVYMWISFATGFVIAWIRGVIRTFQVSRERDKYRAQAARANLKINN